MICLLVSTALQKYTFIDLKNTITWMLYIFKVNEQINLHGKETNK